MFVKIAIADFSSAIAAAITELDVAGPRATIRPTARLAAVRLGSDATDLDPTRLVDRAASGDPQAWKGLGFPVGSVGPTSSTASPDCGCYSRLGHDIINLVELEGATAQDVMTSWAVAQ